MLRKILLILAAAVSMFVWTGPVFSMDPPVSPEGVQKPEPPPEIMRTTGTVEKYVKGKSISITTQAGALTTFAISSESVVKGKVKKGARVTIVYQKQEEKLLADRIVESRR